MQILAAVGRHLIYSVLVSQHQHSVLSGQSWCSVAVVGQLARLKLAG